MPLFDEYMSIGQKIIRAAGNLKNPSKKSEIRVKRVPDSFFNC